MSENTEKPGAKPKIFRIVAIATVFLGALAIVALYYFARGSLLILTNVPATIMLLEGERTVAASDNGRLETPLLLYGSYTLKVDAPGYKSLQQVVTPAFGRGSQEVKITLTSQPEKESPQQESPPAEIEKKSSPPEQPSQVPQEQPPQTAEEPTSEEEAAPVVASPPPVYQDTVTGMEFVTIPEGCFRMGSPASEKGREEDEGPLHEVCIASFQMGKYEVTQGQWEKVMGSNPARFQGGEQYPVEQVSWQDIQDFIQKLNQKTGKQYRLPTEAEWEYAARSGNQTSRPWGDEPDQACQYENLADLAGKKQDPLSPLHNCDDGNPFTAPVGQFQPNKFGLYDMLGNVSEWCDDWYDAGYYQQSPRENPRGGSSSDRRVIRGGSWLSVPDIARSANRYMNVPPIRHSDIGLRLVLPVVP